MAKLRTPKPFSDEGEIPYEWKIWGKHFNLYLTATESDSRSDKVKTPILLTFIGPKGREIHGLFTLLQETDKLNLKIILEKLSA